MKIAHITSVHPAFDVRIFHKECQSLAREGYEVVLVVPHDGDEFIGGVRVRAVSRPKGRLWRMTITTAQVLVAALRESAALYHFHDPELMPAGMVLKLLGKKVIYDVHEDVPLQIMTKAWIPSFLRPLVSRIVYALEAFAARQFGGIVTVTDAIAERFEEINPCTVTLRNWPLKREFEGLTATPFSTGRNTVRVGYFGSITRVRGATVMMRYQITGFYFAR